MAVEPMINRPNDQDHSGASANGARIGHDAEDHDGNGTHQDRHCMPDRAGRWRKEHNLTVWAVLTERAREQPAHCWIEPGEHAEPGERQPWPQAAHFRLTDAAVL